MSTNESTTHADHLAYLHRKLDLHERELAIREREVEVESARLELDRAKFDWVRDQQSDHERHLDGLRDMFEHIAEHAVAESDGPVSRNRGRA
jgi:hypothetical protein